MPKYYPNTTTTNYPFGMLMPGRTYSSEGYSWGFNGKEKDDAISGSGNNLDFGARIYDSRLGRWMALDPLEREYSNLSPYQFVSNSPLIYIDPDGKKIIVTLTNGEKVEYKPGILPENADENLKQVHEAISYSLKVEPQGNIWTQISKSPNNLNIVITNEVGDKSAYEQPILITSYAVDPSGNKIEGTEKFERTESVIRWNPKLGLITTTGGGQSPSTTLYHEGIHGLKTLAVKSIAEFEKLKKERKTNNADYGDLDDLEHSIIIPGEETRYIQKVNAYEKGLSQNLNMNESDGLTYVPQVQSIRNAHRGTASKASGGVNSIPDDAVHGQGGKKVNIKERKKMVLPDNNKTGGGWNGG